MWIAALVTSVVLFGLRLDLSRILGLGDAEALYFAYGLHPQPAYLNQPGLIGWLARCFGPDASPLAIHVATAVAATALPWLGVLAARACGARGTPALRSYFALALLPELCLGSAAFTPDLPFAVFWLAALACAGGALRHPPASFRSLLALLGVGVATALCCLSKQAGWFLALSLAWVLCERPQAARRRTLAPWAAAFVLAILVAPLVRWWLTHGWGLRLGLLSWQQALGIVLRPLVAATPPFLFAGALVAFDLLADQRQSPIDRLLRLNFLIPIVPLLLLALTAGGDPGWLIPAYLTLSLQVARSASLPRRLLQSCVGLGSALALIGWCWLRTDLPYYCGQVIGGYEAAWDTTSDLYTWGPGRPLLQSVVQGARERTGQEPVVVGPHWAVCAQADAALGGHVAVGCDSAELDDYDQWLPATRWSEAATIVLVTDSRFAESAPDTLYGRPVVAVHDAEVKRFGRVVRHVIVAEFDRDEANAASPTETQPNEHRFRAGSESAAPGRGMLGVSWSARYASPKSKTRLRSAAPRSRRLALSCATLPLNHVSLRSVLGHSRGGHSRRGHSRRGHARH
jgi:Dolichyl-phosphate-mannose-protein mannosyltransferase